MSDDFPHRTTWEWPHSLGWLFAVVIVLILGAIFFGSIGAVQIAAIVAAIVIMIVCLVCICFPRGDRDDKTEPEF